MSTIAAAAVAGSEPADDTLSWQTIFGWSVGTIGPVTLLYVVNYSFMFFMTDCWALLQRSPAP